MTKPTVRGRGGLCNLEQYLVPSAWTAVTRITVPIKCSGQNELYFKGSSLKYVDYQYLKGLN